MADLDRIKFVIETLPGARAQVSIDMPAPHPGMRIGTPAHSLAIDALGWLGKQPAVAGFVYSPDPAAQNDDQQILLVASGMLQRIGHHAAAAAVLRAMDASIGPSQEQTDELEATRDMLDTARSDMNLLREALDVPVEPHQSLHERMLEAALLGFGGQRNAAKEARNTGINHGVCLALQIMHAAGNAGGTHWNELLDVAGRAEITNYAKNIEPDEWELCGFAQVERWKAEMQAIEAEGAVLLAARGEGA